MLLMLFTLQHDRLANVLDEERQKNEDRLKEALQEQLETQKTMLQTCLREEQDKNKSELKKATEVCFVAATRQPFLFSRMQVY